MELIQLLNVAKNLKLFFAQWSRAWRNATGTIAVRVAVGAQIDVNAQLQVIYVVSFRLYQLFHRLAKK